MHISVYNPKGGTGKTTLSISLATAFARLNEHARVALVDHDPQASTLIFSQLAQRKGRPLLYTPTNALTKGFDLYIHDFPPTLREDFPGQVIVMPTLLDATSFLVFNRGRKQAEQNGYITVPVANRYRSDRQEQRELVKALQAPVIRDRAVFANAYGQGKTVFDMTQAYSRRAEAEVLHLAEQVKQTVIKHKGK